MKHRLLILVLAAASFAGCSSAYKTAQTPDDVYYSPGSESTGQEQARYNDQRNNGRYETYVSPEDDRYLRMKIQNRNRWSSLDDFDYWYSPRYSINFYGGYGSYNPYLYNNWYSPYYNPFRSTFDYGWYGSYYPFYSHRYYNGFYTPVFGYGAGYGYGGGYFTPTYIMKDPVRRSANVSRPSLSTYTNRNYNNSNSNTNRQSFGSTLRRVLTPSNSNNNTYNSNNYSNSNQRSYSSESNSATYDRPVRSYTPSTSSSSSSSSSSSGSSSGSSGGGVTRQSRGN